MEEDGKSRPNRSDIHLSLEEEAKIETATREYFDGLAPKRHLKPMRSDYASVYADDEAFSGGGNGEVIPELVEFQRLENDPQKLMSGGGHEAMEEFVETEYYKDLNGVDKIHHTTGTGFIRMENKSKSSFSLTPITDHHASCKGNPATNDWIPAAANMVDFSSEKPSRSDS